MFGIKEIILLVLVACVMFYMELAQAMNVTHSFYLISKRVPELSYSDVASIAHLESFGNPYAVSPTGCKGLYQFCPSTWRALNAKHDLHFSSSVSVDIYEQTIMMMYLTQDNIKTLKRLMKMDSTYFNIDVVVIFLMHNCGVVNLFEMMKLDDNDTVDKALSWRIMKSNPRIYLKRNGKPKKKFEVLKDTLNLLNNQ